MTVNFGQPGKHKAWLWNENTVTVVDDKPPVGYGYAGKWGEAGYDVLDLFTAGLAATPPMERAWRVESVEHGHWTAHEIRSDGNGSEAHGSWDVEKKQGTVETVRVWVDGKFGAIINAAGWQQTSSGRMVASVVESRTADGHVFRRLTHVRTENMGISEVAAAAEVPTGTSHDIFRGVTGKVTLVDYRAGEAAATVTTPGMTAPVPLDKTAARNTRVLRWGGWIMAGGVLAAGAYLWRRRLST